MSTAVVERAEYPHLASHAHGCPFHTHGGTCTCVAQYDGFRQRFIAAAESWTPRFELWPAVDEPCRCTTWKHSLFCHKSRERGRL